MRQKVSHAPGSADAPGLAFQWRSIRLAGRPIVDRRRRCRSIARHLRGSWCRIRRCLRCDRRGSGRRSWRRCGLLLSLDGSRGRRGSRRGRCLDLNRRWRLLDWRRMRHAFFRSRRRSLRSRSRCRRRDLHRRRSRSWYGNRCRDRRSNLHRRRCRGGVGTGTGAGAATCAGAGGGGCTGIGITGTGTCAAAGACTGAGASSCDCARAVPAPSTTKAVAAKSIPRRCIAHMLRQVSLQSNDL